MCCFVFWDEETIILRVGKYSSNDIQAVMTCVLTRFICRCTQSTDVSDFEFFMELRIIELKSLIFARHPLLTHVYLQLFSI